MQIYVIEAGLRRTIGIGACALLIAVFGRAFAQSEGDFESRSVFSPSPVPSVLSDEIEPPLLDLNVTGRRRDAFPRLDGDVSIEIQNNHTFKSEDKRQEINDLGMTANLFMAARATQELSVQAALVLEGVKDPPPGQNRYFDDNGMFVETLGLVYGAEDFSLFAGKFNPTFGVAWDLAPGIYGADLADDYELTERIGFGGSVTFEEDAVGEHTLTVQTFFLDTSALSGSVGEPRGRTKEGDGGVSNTQSFQSFSVTLDGELPAVAEELRYQLGVERQQRGRGESDNEWGVAAALYGGFELGPETRIQPVVEWAFLHDQDGQPNAVNYLTVGSGLFVGPWNVAVSCTGRYTRPAQESAFSDRLLQVSAGYEFDFGLAVNAGYGYIEDKNIGNHVVGVLLVYDFDFFIY